MTLTAEREQAIRDWLEMTDATVPHQAVWHRALSDVLAEVTRLRKLVMPDPARAAFGEEEPT